MEIPTKQFRVEGFKGKFSVDKKPKEAIKRPGEMERRMIFEAYWSGTQNEKYEFAYAETREGAFRALIKKITERGLK